jgi:hypothetical protein
VSGARPAHRAARPAPLRAGSLVGALVSRIEDFLLEPADPGGDDAEPGQPGALGPRPVIAVFGLARRCGATTVARALASELAARDPGGAGAVASGASNGAIPLATPPARRLAELLADVPGAGTSAVGRLCLVEGADQVALTDCARHLAPLVLDPGAVEIGVARGVQADRLLLVTSPRVEKALVAAAVSCLRDGETEPLVVANMVRRVEEVPATAGGAAPRPADASGAVPLPTDASGAAPGPATAAALPYSRAGAQLALGGRQPRGEPGRVVAALADLCELPA